MLHNIRNAPELCRAVCFLLCVEKLREQNRQLAVCRANIHTVVLIEPQPSECPFSYALIFIVEVCSCRAVYLNRRSPKVLAQLPCVRICLCIVCRSALNNVFSHAAHLAAEGIKVHLAFYNSLRVLRKSFKVCGKLLFIVGKVKFFKNILCRLHKFGF